jgi:hypothetical protein
MRSLHGQRGENKSVLGQTGGGDVEIQVSKKVEGVCVCVGSG